MAVLAEAGDARGARGPQAAGGTRPSVILTVLLAVMLVNHVGALIVARNRTSREQPGGSATIVLHS